MNVAFAATIAAATIMAVSAISFETVATGIESMLAMRGTYERARCKRIRYIALVVLQGSSMYKTLKREYKELPYHRRHYVNIRIESHAERRKRR